MRHLLRQGLLIAALLTLSLSMPLVPSRLMAQEAAKARPAEGAVLQHFKKWEEALAKIDRMKAVVHATGKGNAGFLAMFPLTIKYWKTTKNASEIKNYDFSFSNKTNIGQNRIMILDRYLFEISETENTVKISNFIGGFDAQFKNTQENEGLLSWLFEGMVFDFRFVFFALSPSEVFNRYQVQLLSEDAHYAQFELLPSNAKDRKYLNWARIVLDKKTSLLKKVTYADRSGEIHVFDIKNLDLDPKFQPSDLEAPTPQTWKGFKFSPSKWPK